MMPSHRMWEISMSGSRLGNKHSCFGCGAKFYDLNRGDVVCPRCGADQAEAPRGTDMATIAAKVLASSVTDTEEPGDGYGPVADEMELFGAENLPGDTPASGSGTGSSGQSSSAEQPEFDDDEY